MNEKVSHVYCVPGMAADVSIFEYIKLPEDQFKMHMIPWKIPYKKESIASYAKRMCEEVLHKDVILVGVSFGGMIVQEMSKYLCYKKIVIISSVKSKYELPKRMHFIRKTFLYKIFPTWVISRIENWENFAIGNFAKKRAVLYQKYLSVKDKRYLDWAIKNSIYWKQETPPKHLIHIHGTSDIIFPITYIKDCILVEKGTHVMIINRARWFNKNLPEIINASEVIP